MVPTRAMPRWIGVDVRVLRRRREPEEGWASRVEDVAVMSVDAGFVSVHVAARAGWDSEGRGS